MRSKATTWEGVKRLKLARMVRGLVPRWSLLSLILCFQLLARTQAQEATIASITVKGNKNLNSEFIINASGLRVGGPVNQSVLDEAKRRLLQTQLFGANLEDEEDAIRIEALLDEKGAQVTIEVQENDLVRGINITGTGPIPAKVIRELLMTKEGFVLNMGTLRRDANAIQEYYRSKGYLASVSSDLSMPDGILEIPIVVARVDEVKLSGLKKTRPYVITRETKLKKGEYYNAETLQKDYYKIVNTDLFSEVSPAVVLKSPGLVDITWNLVEKRTGNFMVFIGYSSRNSLVGGAELVENNFRGRGQSVSLRWDRGGYADRTSIEAGFTEPWLDSKNTSLSVSVYDKTVYRFSRSVYGTAPVGDRADDYYEVHTGGQVNLGRPLTETYRASVGLRVDNVDLPALNVSAVDASALQKGPIYVLSGRLTHNTRDVNLDPSSGGFEVYSLDLGTANLKPAYLPPGTTPLVQGSVSFQKLQVDARRYFSLRGKRKNANERIPTLALRLSVGLTGGTVPFFEQYFMGGAETLRGYHEDRFWGKYLFLISAELRAPLANALTGVVFVDVGDAWGGPYSGVRLVNFEQHRNFQPRVGIGVGLRVMTPIGAIRIDQGFGSEGGRTHFSIGHVF